MIFLGLLRTAGLRLMGGIFGAWIDPLARMMAIAAACVVLTLLAVAVWPTGKGQVERAALDALAAREQITGANIDEEKRDNAWIEMRQHWLRAARDAANTDRDAVLWPASDGWLRKRAAAAR
jgi:uncharacterized membrane protein